MNRLSLYQDEPQKANILPKLCESLQTAFRLHGLSCNMLPSGEEIRIDIGHHAAWIDKDGKLTGESNMPDAPMAP